MKFAFSILALCFATSASNAIEVEIIPCIKRLMADEKVVCCLKKNETELTLFIGDQEIKRFPYSYGANMTEARSIHDDSLKTALETLLLLRQSNVCK